MAEQERVYNQPFPPAPRAPEPPPPLPGGTLGELLTGLRVLRPEDKLADNLTRIEAALARLERLAATLPPHLPRR